MNAQADIVFNTNSSALSAALEARGLLKYFGEQCVLDKIHLAIPSGSVVGLIGCNGAGKSTLIRCLLGLMTRDAGDCLVFGEPSLTLSDKNKARIGYVPQQPEALGWLSVKQMLDFVSGFYPRWDYAFVDASLARWNINTGTLLSKLSPGERQRIAVLRAMAYHPELLVLDEPAAALDPVARRELLRDIATRAADSGTTVLFSTHIVSDLERVASDIIFVHEKNVLLQMSMDDIKEHTLCLRLSPEAASQLTGKVPGEISRRRHQDAGMTIVLKREHHQEWPALCDAPGVRREKLSLEDLFIEVAQ